MADYTILPRWTAVANLSVADDVYNGFRWLHIVRYERTLDRVTVTYGASHPQGLTHRPETSVTYRASDRLYARRMAI